MIPKFKVPPKLMHADTIYSDNFSLKRRIYFYIFSLMLLVVLRPAFGAPFNRDEVEVSYIYAAVMGSGTYQIGNRRITMLRLPFSWNQSEATADSAGWKWLLPLVLGYDDLSNADSNWIDLLLPDQLITFTMLPGIEYIYPVNSGWHLKPFLQFGGGRDFSLEQSFTMAQSGVRSLNFWQIGQGWEVRWGNGLRWAGEYQQETGDSTSFGLLETGLDVRRDIPLVLSGHRLDVGAYYVYQRFLPEWNADEAPDIRAKLSELHELGLSVGLKQKKKLLGISIRRVRLGYKTGGVFQGWTIGTDFPF